MFDNCKSDYLKSQPTAKVSFIHQVVDFSSDYYLLRGLGLTRGKLLEDYSDNNYIYSDLKDVFKELPLNSK